MSNLDYYTILQVGRKDDVETIKKSYEKLVMHYADRYAGNPDVQAHLNLLMDAYSVLSDPQKRAEYDRTLPHLSVRKRSGNFWGNIKKLLGVKNKKPSNVISIQKGPTFSQLLDFDWDALEEKKPDSPEKRKAFWDELTFKLIVLLLFLILLVIIWVVFVRL